MKKTFILDDTNAELSAEELAMLAATDNMTSEPDDDCPEMTPEQYEYYSKILAERKSKNRTRVVSIRLSEDTLAKAKRLGNGYTGVMGRIVEYGLSHPEVLSKCI